MPSLRTTAVSEQNPENPEIKQKHLRHRMMLIIEALGLEALLGYRKKNIAETYRAEKETVVMHELPIKKAENTEDAKKPEDLDLLDKLFAALKSALRKTLEAAKTKAEENVNHAVKNGSLSAKAAKLVRQAINAIYSEKTITEATENVVRPKPSFSKVKVEDEELKKQIENANGNYQHVMSSKKSTPIERLTASATVAQLRQLAQMEKDVIRISRGDERLRQEVMKFLQPLCVSQNDYIRNLSVEIENVFAKPEFSNMRGFGNPYTAFPFPSRSVVVDSEKALEMFNQFLSRPSSF